jgi:hypothetical protein
MAEERNPATGFRRLLQRIVGVFRRLRYPKLYED